MKHLDFGFLVLAALLIVPRAGWAQQKDLDTDRIQKTTGLQGTLDKEEGVFKVTKPRTDIGVTVDRRPLPPFLGLSSWAAFQKGKAAEAMVMGDLVLLEDEVNPVMSELFEGGLSVTALHNHFFYDQPRVFFMHVAGEGKADDLAKAIRKAFDRQEAVRSAGSQEPPDAGAGFPGKPVPTMSSITGSVIDSVFGRKAELKDGMAKVTIGRKTTSACGCEVGKTMGVNTWVAFSGSDEQALVDGDFAVLEDELQPVLRSLRKSGINIVAIHNHMTHENPRVLFLHYWGRGRAEDLAKAVKAAVDLTK